jgi:hypothetical protein
MDDLISRANLLKALAGLIPYGIAASGAAEFSNGLHAAYVCVKEVPTVPAEVVRHGRWEYREELQYFTIIEMMDCSVCGEHQNPEQVEAWAYCPNCGARMDLDPAAEKEDSR